MHELKNMTAQEKSFPACVLFQSKVGKWKLEGCNFEKAESKDALFISCILHPVRPEHSLDGVISAVKGTNRYWESSLKRYDDHGRYGI